MHAFMAVASPIKAREVLNTSTLEGSCLAELKGKLFHPFHFQKSGRCSQLYKEIKNEHHLPKSQVTMSLIKNITESRHKAYFEELLRDLLPNYHEWDEACETISFYYITKRDVRRFTNWMTRP